MKWRLFWVLFWLVALEGNAQKLVAEKGAITFFSDALIEDITATNTKASSIFNIETSELVFSVPIREFQFDKKLMQEHFNEKYMESDKYPKATFSGKISGFDKTLTDPQYVKAKGKLIIHGVAKEIEVEGIAQSGTNTVLKSKFMIRLADYKVEIPQLMFQNIAEEVEVTLEFTYKAQ